MNITVLGCGRWGSFLAWYLNSIGNNVLLWGRDSSEKFRCLKERRYNEYVKLPIEINLCNSLQIAVEFADVIFIAINEQNLRDLMKSIVLFENYTSKSYVICMKGLENTTCKRLSEVVYEYIGNNDQIAAIVGPAQPADLVNGSPTCMIIDSHNKILASKLAKSFSRRLVHFCVGDDLIGNEIGAALNKIIGIAGGVLDELGHSSLKGILMVIGTQEIATVINAMGGNPSSAYGLCCLGDYQASVFSDYSNSVAYGKTIVQKATFDKHAPGAFTAQTIVDLMQRYRILIPLLSQVANIILGLEEPIQMISTLINYNG